MKFRKSLKQGVALYLVVLLCFSVIHGAPLSFADETSEELTVAESVGEARNEQAETADTEEPAPEEVIVPVKTEAEFEVDAATEVPAEAAEDVVPEEDGSQDAAKAALQEEIPAEEADSDTAVTEEPAKAQEEASEEQLQGQADGEAAASEEMEVPESADAAQTEEETPVDVVEEEATTAEETEKVTEEDTALTLTEEIDEAALVGASTENLLNKDAQYLTRFRVSSTTTGTAPWDDEAKPGNDTSDSDNIVRTYDSVNYTISSVSKGYDTTVSYKAGYAWYRFVVPGTADATAQIDAGADAATVLSNEMEIDLSSMGWVTKGTGTDYDYQLTYEKIDGRWCQVLVASNYLTSATSAFPIALSNVNLSLNVKNMKNGDKIKPVIYGWLDHNDVDKTNWDTAYACAAHKSAANGGKELMKIETDEITVSAAPKYNVQIKETGTGWVGAEGSFDFTTGNEKTAIQGSQYNCFGQIRAYGITVQLYNDTPSKGLKGIEMPTGDIKFDLDMVASYQGTGGNFNMTSDTFIPKVWSYDRNYSPGAQQDGRNLSDYTSIHFARDAAPYAIPSTSRDKINGTQNSGTWAATQQGGTVHFTVSGYEVNPFYMPVLDYGDYNATDDYGPHIGGFSAGEVFLVIPYGQTDNYLLNNYGSGRINLDLQLSHFEAKSLTGQVTNTIQDPPNAHRNISINFVGPGDLIDELMWSYPHRDGETRWTDVDDSSNHIDDGGDSAQTGQQVDIIFGYGLTNNSQARSWYGLDTLMTFDPTAFEFDTAALDAGEITSLIEEANKGDNGKQTVEYYFAVADHKLSDDEMKKINVDGKDDSGNTIANLTYYKDYTAAKAAGTIVGALQSVRYPAGTKASMSRLYTTGALHLKVRNDEDAMKPVDEGGILNGVYGTTIVTRGYFSDGDVMPAVAVTADGKYNTALDEWFANPDPQHYSNPGRKALRGTWDKAVWANDGSLTYAGAGGHWWGDSLHIVPYKAVITKNILQTTGAEHNTEKQTYNLDNNQNIVDFKITPGLTDGTAVVGETPVTITVTDYLDEGLQVETDKVYYGGTYTENEEQGFAGSFSGGAVAGETASDGVVFESVSIEDEVDAQGAATGRKILTVELSNVYVNQALEPIYYSANIYLATSYKSRQYKNVADIDAPGDRRPKDEAAGNRATAGFTVEKNLSLSLAKRSEKPMYEIGEDVTYILSWANTGANLERNCIMMDSMPKDGVGNNSFSGTYNIFKEMTVTAPESLALSAFSFYYTEDEAAHEKISGDYKLAEIRSDWTEVEIGEDGSVDLGEVRPTAWCVIGNVPAKEQLECRFTIDCSDAQPGDVVENTSSLKEGSVTSTTRIVARKLSGLTWIDANKNGEREDGEALLPGVMVRLYRLGDAADPAEDNTALVGAAEAGESDEDGVYVNLRGERSETETDENGAYEFDALGSGIYRVEMTDGTTSLAYYVVTLQQADGVGKAVNSDAAGETDGDGYTAKATILKDLDTEDLTLPETWDTAELGYVYEIPYLDAGFYPIYPEVEIEKTADREATDVGETITYTIAVTNTEKIDAVDYLVTDTLGTGLTYISDNKEGTADGNVITWTLTIPAGSTVEIELQATVTDEALQNVTNNASVRPPEDPDKEKTTEVETPLVPHFEVEKVADRTDAKVGDVITYTITVTATGKADCVDLAIEDILPEELAYVSDDQGGTVNGQVISWTKTIAAGDRFTAQVKAEVLTDSKEELVNVVTVTGTDGRETVTKRGDATVKITPEPEPETPPTPKKPTITPNVKAPVKAMVTAVKTADDTDLLAWITIVWAALFAVFNVITLRRRVK